MAKRAILTTQEYLINAPLPEATETYTVIPHSVVIEKTKEALAAKGLQIERELYRCNQGANVATGVYHINYGNDPDMGMLFAWTNSYDKSTRFKCTIGGFVHQSLSTIVGGNMGTYGRKHTGTADNEAFQTIGDQINNADTYFAQLVSEKEIMKSIAITDQTRAELMGRIYFIHELLTGEQLSVVKQEFANPSFNYSGVDKSAWSMYNSIIFSLQKAHPKTWLDQQRMIHWFLMNNIGATTASMMMVQENTNPDFSNTINQDEVSPNQLSLLDQIAEAEAEATAVSMLYGVDNDIEVSVSRGNDFDVDYGARADEEADMIKLEQAILERETEVAVDEDAWPCLRCGEQQPGDAVFYDGQLCRKCNDDLNNI